MPSTERFERLSELFEHARLRPPNERAEYLETACADDAALPPGASAGLRAALVGDRQFVIRNLSA